jgi:pimeloyl-ACP methyl ester carboxylesterase
MRAVEFLTTVLLTTGMAYAASPVRYSLDPVPGMTRAELVVIMHTNPVATLVLAPGCNGDGETMVMDTNCIRFAEEKRLILVGLSFASEINSLHDGTGYYYAKNGSGKLLLDALDRLTKKHLPVLLYGFSGGAHFTARFAEWRPERVAAWCAYSAGWWDDPLPSACMPLGIIACGENDPRLGASLSYFKRGRAIGKPWLWVGVPENGHVPDARVGVFVRDYFTTVLDGIQAPNKQQGGWVDIEEVTVASENLHSSQPTVTGWLPDMKLFSRWKALMYDKK